MTDPQKPPQKWYQVELIALLLRHLAAGCFGAVLIGLGVLWYDIGGIRTLAFQAPLIDCIIVLFLLFGGLIATFGSVAMGLGVMGMGKDDPP